MQAQLLVRIKAREEGVQLAKNQPNMAQATEKVTLAWGAQSCQGELIVTQCCLDWCLLSAKCRYDQCPWPSQMAGMQLT